MTKKRVLFAFIILVVLIVIFVKVTTVEILGERYSIFSKEIFLNSVSGKNFNDKDMENVKKLKYLQRFQSNGGDITNLDFLRGKKKLTFVSISLNPENQIYDFAPITECESIEVFFGVNLYVENLDMFKNLSDLTFLDIWYSSESDDNFKITDISALNNLKKINYLSFSKIDCEDYSVLTELKELTYLKIPEGELPKEIKQELLNRGVKISEIK